MELSIRRRINRRTGLPYAHHRTDTLRWLNVCFVDLDCYALGRSVEDALVVIEDLQNAGTIPPVTMFGRSGRGLWLFWLLIDVKNPSKGVRVIHRVVHGPLTPQRASPAAMALYARVQQALGERLINLGADTSGRDAARFAPVPGTWKTAIAQRVHYRMQDLGGYAHAYTLPALAAALGLDVDGHQRPVGAVHQPVPGPRHDERVAAGKKGSLARWRRVSTDLQTLMRLRGGGFRRGCRNRGAFFIALAMFRAGTPESDIRARLTAFGRNCQPPLKTSRIQPAINQAQRGRRHPSSWVSHRRMLDDLHVTEHEEHSLLFLRRREKPTRLPTRRTTAARRAAISALINEGHTLSVRDMVARLIPKGFNCSAATVWRDCQQLRTESGS